PRAEEGHRGFVQFPRTYLVPASHFDGGKCRAAVRHAPRVIQPAVQGERLVKQPSRLVSLAPGVEQVRQVVHWPFGCCSSPDAEPWPDSASSTKPSRRTCGLTE